MDFVRGTCIILVILLHAMAAVNQQWGVEAPAQIDNFNLAFAPFRMPTLMFLSGMLLVKSLNKDVPAYIYGKLSLIFWPFIFWSLVVLAAEQRFTIEYLLKLPISAPTVLWYLWFICAYYMLALALHRLKISFALVAISALVASIFLPDFLRISRFAYLFFFFLMGAWVHAVPDTVLRNRWVTGLGAMAAIAGAALSIAGVRLNYAAEYSWAPIGMIAVVLGFARYYSSNFLSPVVEFIGRNSIVFYCVHFPVQWTVVRLLPDTVMGHYVPAYLLAVAAALVVATSVQLLRARFKMVAATFDASYIMPRRVRQWAAGAKP
jgi:fucose 4-O-acetylase-like acetyltransferase